MPRPDQVNLWFPPEQQQHYIDRMVDQSGLTRRQAICFVRLWGYAHLQSGSAPPIQTLSPHQGIFYCSHSDAANLFYCDRPTGSDRSAGMMLDQLVAKRLVRREPFDGTQTRLSLQVPSTFLPAESVPLSTVYPDTFDLRCDAPLVAAILEASYSWMRLRPAATSFKMTRVLRQWAGQYPDGLRVLRTEADHSPVGLSVFFPVHSSCEEQFHLSPSGSLYLSTANREDPIRVAAPEDPDCYVVFVRSWQLAPRCWNYGMACLMLQDSQETLGRMQREFPNLCDIYTITIHPRLEAFALALGFKVMKTDPASSLSWLYLPLDRFLALDVDEALVEFDFGDR
ncbi:MAG: hypothetical protein AAF289_04390 [Cyanobacteria bacterium P01_A01_bin.135]